MLDEVRKEAMRADARFGAFHSSHEGFGVLAEEVAELLDAIRANNRHSVQREAVQVAAVALRIATGCNLATFCERSGFDAMP